MKVTDIKHLVLSGGGLLGISYIGLIKYLEENLPKPMIKNIKSITGCSAGAMFGVLVAIGYTSAELDIIAKSMNFKEYININAESLINFMKLKGLESGKNMINFIKKCIKDKIKDENITFKELKDKFNIELQIGVTNLTKSKFEIMNSKNTPNIPIHKAISASIAVPFVFEPIVIEDNIYCDGGLLNNLPIDIFSKDNNIFEDESNEDKEDKEDNESKKDNESKETMESNEDISITNISNISNISNKDDKIKYSSVLAIYLLTDTHIVNKDNYQSISLSEYMTTIIHALSYEFINKKIHYNEIINNSKEKHKIIVFNIPCDIMTFLKISSSNKDIDNIIDIAYKITSASF